MFHARCSAFAALVAAFALPLSSAQGQPVNDPFAVNGRASDWRVIVGAGGAVRPTFEGSDRYFISPVPLVSINYNDTISLDTSGLSAYWRKDGLQIGGGVTYNLGRRQGGNSVFTPGDERLNGLGDIPAALGLRAFANYRLGRVILGSTLTKFLADGNNGLLINASLEMPYRLGDSTTLTGRLFGTWADQNYMQTWFGVTPGQSITSSYAVYQPGSGVKDVGVSLSVRHQLSPYLVLSGEARLSRLTGVAEDSPITVSKVNSSFLMMIGYRF